MRLLGLPVHLPFLLSPGPGPEARAIAAVERIRTAMTMRLRSQRFMLLFTPLVDPTQDLPWISSITGFELCAVDTTTLVQSRLGENAKRISQNYANQGPSGSPKGASRASQRRYADGQYRGFDSQLIG
jgi:hypothetical protein